MDGYHRLGENSWEITAGVWLIRLPLPFSVSFINVYLLRGESGYVLVDCGLRTPMSLDQLEAAFKDIGMSADQITHILVTHIHPDHYGQAAEIKRRSGADLLLHQTEATLVYSRYLNMDRLLEQIKDWLMQHGTPEEDVDLLHRASLALRDFVELVEADRLLQGGERIPVHSGELEVLWTPGHAPGHVCFYFAEKRLLFSGDHVLEHITPNIGFHPQSSDNPLGDYLSSLDRLLGLEADLILPAHGNPFTNLRGWIERIKAHHHERCEKIYRTIRNGAKTAYEMIPKIWGPNLSALNRRLALAEALSHLELMRLSGRVRRDERGGLIYWAAQ